jgi:hypothetical protein
VRNSRDDAAIDYSESHYSSREMEEKWRTFVGDDKRYNGKFAIVHHIKTNALTDRIFLIKDLSVHINICCS